MRRPKGKVEGFSLDRFEPGLIYDVGSDLGNVVLAERWAEPVDDQRPAMVIPLAEENSTPLILIVDDDRQTRTMLSTMLCLQGYAVQTATDGEDGLRKLQEYVPALVLLDLKMPRMSGAEFRAAQERLPRMLADIPVVIISGVEGGDHHRRERLHAVDYIPKPIDDVELLKVVRAQCGTPDA